MSTLQPSILTTPGAAHAEAAFLADRARCWRWSASAPAGLFVLLATAASLGFAPSTSAAFSFTGLSVLAMALAAGVTDTLSGKIYNWLTYPGLLWGLALNAAVAAGLPDWPWIGAIGLSASFQGAAAGFVVMLLVHDVTGGGRGDLKLVTALGAYLGWRPVLALVFLSYGLAGFAVVGIGARRYGLGVTLRSFGKMIGRWFLPGWVVPDLNPTERAFLQERVRLGAFLAVSAALVMTNPGGVLTWLGLLPAGGLR